MPRIVITMRKKPSISGRVVDGSGQPAEGVRIGHLPRLAGVQSTAATDPDGYFELFAPDRGELAPVRLVLVDAGGFGPLRGGTDTVEWNTSGVLLVIGRACTLEIRVYDALSGSPVRSYDAYYASRDHALVQGHPMSNPVRSTGDGGLVLTGLYPGPTHLLIYPHEPRLRPSAPVLVDCQEGVPGRVEVRLSRATPLTVAVSDERGAPVSGCLVEILDRGDDADSAPLDWTTPLFETIDGVTEVYRPRDSDTLLIDKGTTGTDGRVTLAAYSRHGQVDVRVTGPGHPAALCEQVALGPGPQHIAIGLRNGASLTGVLQPSEVLAWRPLLQVRVDGDVVRGPGPLGCFPIDGHGRFEVRGLPAGECEVFLAFRRGRVYVIGRKAAGRVRLREGEPADLNLDGSMCAPGDLEGLVFVNGEPWGNSRVRLHPVEEGKAARGFVAQAATLPQGSFRIEDVPAGEYRLVGAPKTGARIEFAEPVVITPGATTRASFSVLERAR